MAGFQLTVKYLQLHAFLPPLGSLCFVRVRCLLTWKEKKMIGNEIFSPFLFRPFEIRNGTLALACLPRIKGEPPHSADKGRKPFRRQDSKLRLGCDDSELDAAHVGIIILVDVAVVIALIAPKGGRELQQQKLRIRLFYISPGRLLICDLHVGQ